MQRGPGGKKSSANTEHAMEIPDLVSAEAEEAGAERSGGALTRRRARSGHERMPFSWLLSREGRERMPFDVASSGGPPGDLEGGFRTTTGGA
jgi:hypothetical protein